MIRISEKGYTLCYESDAGWHILKHFKDESESDKWRYKQGQYLDVIWERDGKWEWPAFVENEGVIVEVERNINTAAADKRKNPKYCIFEDKICSKASNQNGVFECKVESDESMPCRR